MERNDYEKALDTLELKVRFLKAVLAGIEKFIPIMEEDELSTGRYHQAAEQLRLELLHVQFDYQDCQIKKKTCAFTAIDILNFQRRIRNESALYDQELEDCLHCLPTELKLLQYYMDPSQPAQKQNSELEKIVYKLIGKIEIEIDSIHKERDRVANCLYLFLAKS